MLDRSPGPVKLHVFASSRFPPEDVIAPPMTPQLTGRPPATIEFRTTLGSAPPGLRMNAALPNAADPPGAVLLSVTVTFVRVIAGVEGAGSELMVRMPPERKALEGALAEFWLTV